MSSKYSGFEEYDFYPCPKEVEDWLSDIYRSGSSTAYRVSGSGSGFDEKLWIPHLKGASYIRFEPENRRPFYCYWQPSPFGKAPLIVHTPGGGAEIVIHPEIAMQGYNILHINPLGYMTPDGNDITVIPDRSKPPVIYETIISDARKGYKDWLTDCVIAIGWAFSQQNVSDDGISFFGTSQGGFGALILSSLFRDKGVRCVAAEEPFAVDFPFVKNNSGSAAYDMVYDAISAADDNRRGWHAAGMIDVISHSSRLDIPVLLTAGGKDELCPAEAIERLFRLLSAEKMYFYNKDQSHEFSPKFVNLAISWFKMHV